MARPSPYLGYGSQGHAQAQNLRDSGYNVIIGLDPTRPSARQARSDGFDVYSPAEAAKRADWIQVLTPDETQGELYASSIEPHLTAGKILGVSHGFSLHFKTITPPNDVDVVMIAPKSPGHLVRRIYTEGRGVPSLLAVKQNASGRAQEYALCYAYGIGSTPGRCSRNHVSGRNGKRPFRRASSFVRRFDFPHQERI